MADQTPRPDHPRRLALTKSNSATSHVSVPVTGAIPLGGLHVVRDEPPSAGVDEKSRARAALLARGDVFLVLDLPAGFLLGCDAAALTVRDARPAVGLRGLPAGPHLVFVGDPAATVSRCGYWFLTDVGTGGGGKVRVKQWDRYNEVLGEPASAFEAKSAGEDVVALQKHLVPYAQAGGEEEGEEAWGGGAARVWQRVSSCITRALLARVVGGPADASDEWPVDAAVTVKGEVSFAQASRLFKSVAGAAGELTFLLTRGDDDEAVLRSAGDAAGDTTGLITAVLDRPDIEEGDVVGELQFAFLTALHLGNPSCLSQWTHLVLRVVLRAYGLVATRPALARTLVETIHAQLLYSDQHTTSAASSAEETGGSGGGILDMLSSGTHARLRGALTAYKRQLNRTLLDAPATVDQAAVGSAFAELEEWLWKYGWDLRSDHDGVDNGKSAEYSGAGGQRRGLEDGDSDDEDYQPVVVELDEAGREVGLVSWNS